MKGLGGAGSAPASMPTIGDGVAFVVGRLIALLLKGLQVSWRVNGLQIRKLDEQVIAGTPVIAVFWHGSYLPLFALAAGRSIVVFTSTSFRGKVIANICHAFGYAPYLLPDGRDGYRRMRTVLAKRASESSAPPPIIAIAVDGPLGPRHRVKLGALHLAAHLGAVIMPIRLSSKPNWVARNRWDRFAVPLPLASVRLEVGAAISVLADLGKDHGEVLRLRQRVHDQLNGLPATDA